MNTILKGSTSGPIEIRLAPGFDYAGKTVHVNYQGVTRDFPDCAAGGKLELSYGAKETAPMALGVWPIAVWITDEDGTVIRVASTESRIRVTDEPSEVHTSGVIGIEAKGVLAGIEDLPDRYTDADVVAKLREILRAGGAAVRTLLVCAALLGAALLNAATVQTAPKQAIYNDQQVVTNVTFEGLATLDDLKGAGVSPETVTNIVKSVAANPEDYTTTNAVKDIVTNDVVCGFSAWEISGEDYDSNKSYDIEFYTLENHPETAWPNFWKMQVSGYNEGFHYSGSRNPDAIDLSGVWTSDYGFYDDLRLSVVRKVVKSNALGLARLKDICDLPTPKGVTNIVRDLSLGGIWDAELQVWWTPRMRNGSLTYEATTNVLKFADIDYVDTAASNTLEYAKAYISADNPTFSNAVLSVGLNVDTNSVAVLTEIAETFGGFPIEGTATTVGGLLAALAAAVAWLKKNKADKATTLEGYGITDAATKSEVAAIDARLHYQLNAVADETGLLKDRAINTTSLASVTVQENFTDLLIRAQVASSLSVTMPEAITKYGDTFPGEAGEYLITITKTGAAEAYVRTIKLEEVANA